SKGAFRLARPVEEIAIPSTVQAVLAARIDRLPEREKAVLQTAAVIGRELPEPLLGRVADLPAAERAAAVQSVMPARCPVGGPAADGIGARNGSERVYHWRQVRTLLAGVPESPETLALGVLARRNVIYGSYTLGSWEDDAPAVFAEGMALAERLGDASPRVRL